MFRDIVGDKGTIFIVINQKLMLFFIKPLFFWRDQLFSIY